MATEFDSAGGSKERRTDEEGDQVAEEDRISDLPEALRLHILGLLPFKSAIRTGALSTQWRALWTRRWPAPASLDFRLAPGDSPQPLLDSMERRGRRRLDRFSLSCQIGQLNDKDSGRCLDYAAACAVADLDIHLCKSKKIYNFFSFRLPTGGNPHLARLSLTCIHVGHFPYDSHHYSVLEVIHLHHVTISDESLLNLVAACPLLRTLDIRYCELRCAYLMGAGARLKNVTVAECKRLTDVFLGNLSSLRSFRYSGCYMAADEIPTSSAIDDLYICFGGPACRWLRSRCTIYDARGRLCKFRGCWLGTLISLSNLTVLTVCSSALRRVSAKARARSIAGNAASCKLQNLREVQLLMFAMYNENLNDIMTFLTTCCTLRLERLFVQLPTRSYQYKPYEEPSESEEELSEAETSEEDLSMGEESEEDQSEQYESEEDHANGDESDEDGSEEDHSQEDHSEEDHLQEDDSEEDHPQEADSEEDHSQEGDSEEDHPQEADSEEDHSQESDSEENHSQEDDSEEDHSQEGDSEANHSQEEESEEDQPKENGSEEQGFAEGQSKEDGSKREFSDGGQPLDEPQNGCENLMLLKMTNFMGHHNEMRLVSFVLKKSARLNQLMLFTPESDYPGGPQKDHLNTSDFLQTKLLPLEKASPNAQIILSEPDATAIKPLHSETFVKILEKDLRSPSRRRI